MSERLELRLNSDGQAATEAIGEHIGARLRGGEVFDLISDIGGGKTTLVRGLARGAGSSDQVASPTFTVSRLYKSDKLHIHHFDFYRLPEAGLMTHGVAELLEDPTNVVVAEWSGAIDEVLPDGRVSLTIDRVKTGEDDRLIVITVPQSLAYIVEGLA